MKCPECVKEGKTSRVYPGSSFITAMWCQPYYDEQGRYHNHDLSTTTQDFFCSNGHHWRESSQPPCPICGKSWLEPLRARQ